MSNDTNDGENGRTATQPTRKVTVSRRGALKTLASAGAVAVAGGAAAAPQIEEVLSDHSTKSELNSADTLSGVSVDGSGEDAVVNYSGGGGGVIESFEGQDLTGYTGPTGDFSVGSGSGEPVNPTDGSYMLKGSGGGQTAITGGTPNGPTSQGDTVKVDLALNTNNTEAVGFMFFSSGSVDGGSGDLDGYLVKLVAGASIQLTRWDNGSETGLKTSTNPVLSGKKYYTITLTTSTSTPNIEAEITDDNGDTWTISSNDTTYTSGDNGFFSNGASIDGPVFADYARIV
jgi:hypothetical protein